jgi:molybdopterin-guanine dinucleotide biosynthesis protein A
MSDFTVAIIAGGKSSRMGTDKSFVPLLGKPMIERVIERVAALGQAATILVTNKPELYAHLGLPMVGDVLPDKGSLGGIYTGIYHRQQPYTLAVACDMPFLNTAFLRYLLALRGEPGGPYDVIVPRQDGYPEGLHAVYSAACLEPIRQRLEANQLKVIGFYDTVRVRYVDEPEYARFDPRGRSFRNINTPDELRAAEQLPDQ